MTDIAINATVDATKFTRGMRAAPGALASGLRAGFLKYLALFRTKMSTERLRGRPGLNRRRGQAGGLVSSQKIIVVGNTLRTLKGTYAIGGDANPYAAIHETGGVIVPKHGKYLCIPIGEALTPAGVPREPSIRALVSAGKSEGGFFKMSRESGVFIVPGKGPMMLLVKRVQIPPRLGLAETFRSDEPTRARVIGAAVQAALAKAPGTVSPP